jgi:putative addiction module component (TIGR02574 family)
MKLADFPSVAALSAAEKLQLVDEIWASVGEGLSRSEVSVEEKKLLDERWAAYERNPESAMTLEKLQKKVAALRK